MKGPSRTAETREADDRIEPAARRATRWDSVLVWFMRAVALAWVAKGLLAWASIVDVRPDARPFEAEPFGRQAVIVYFAVIDLTAAVGLWLTSAWGGVVWLLATTSALTLALLTPRLLPAPAALTALEAGAVLAYFALSYLAARESQ